jgi:hypothetical protein
MWWEPTDELTAATSREVGRLLGRYREHLDETGSGKFGGQLVWGVGSAPGGRSDWRHPLVLASYEGLAEAGTPIAVGRYPWPLLIRSIEGRRGPVEALLQRWDLTADTVVDVTTRPLAAAQVDSTDTVLETRSRTMQATVGLPCTLLGSSDRAFITAGHLVTGNGDQVEVGATGSGALAWVTGTVVEWSDPIQSGSNGDYDYAVVRLDDPNDTVGTLNHAGLEPVPTHPHQPKVIDVYGRLPTPVRRTGSVSGALAQLGDAARQWLDCWQFASLPALQPGDSGSVALGANGTPSADRVFGHFVGLSVAIDASGASIPGAVHQYVQDLRSCLAAGLDQAISI